MKLNRYPTKTKNNKRVQGVCVCVCVRFFVTFPFFLVRLFTGDLDAGTAVEEPSDHRVRREEKHIGCYHLLHPREKVRTRIGMSTGGQD